MKVLVTGADAGLGREIAEAASPPGAAVAGSAAGDLGENGEDARALLEDADPDFVVHAASWDDVEGAESAPERAFSVNRDRTARVADACRAAAVPLLHLSTAEVFDGRKHSPYTELDATGPVNVYGRSMLAGEEAVRSALDRHLILRLSWVFGPAAPGFVGTVLGRAREESLLEIPDDQRGSPTPASAVAGAVHEISGHLSDPDFEGWGTWHFAGSRPMTWYAFAREILDRARSLGRFRCAVVPVPAGRLEGTAPRPANGTLDPSRAERLLGLDPPDPGPGLDRVVAALVE